MYTTKPLSVFKSHPAELAASCMPSKREGPSSGYLVVKSLDDVDDDNEMEGYWDWRARRGETPLVELPFPQDRVLTVRCRKETPDGAIYCTEDVVFVPVPDQPLGSTNRYYAVIATGKHRGLIRACSREEDMVTRCFFRCIKDAKPRPFDPADVYQQMEVVQHEPGRFTARAVVDDAFPAFLYRQKYWRVYASSKHKRFHIGGAQGLDVDLRSRLLADSSIHVNTSVQEAAVGRWICPFYLIKEDGVAPQEQMERSVFYEVVLEQRWEQVHDVSNKVATKQVFLHGNVKADQDAETTHQHNDGYVYFKTPEGQRLGVCVVLWERMLWEEHRSGWVEEDSAGKFAAAGSVTVLVERFVLKRMDDSVVAAFDFVHLKTIRANQP